MPTLQLLCSFETLLSPPKKVGYLKGTLDLLVVPGILWRPYQCKLCLSHLSAKRECPREAEQGWCDDALALQPQPLPLPMPSNPSAISFCSPLAPFQGVQPAVAAGNSNYRQSKLGSVAAV